MSKEVIVTGDLRLMKLSTKKSARPRWDGLKLRQEAIAGRRGEGGGGREEKAIGWAVLLRWEYKQKNSKRVKGEKS